MNCFIETILVEFFLFVVDLEIVGLKVVKVVLGCFVVVVVIFFGAVVDIVGDVVVDVVGDIVVVVVVFVVVGVVVDEMVEVEKVRFTKSVWINSKGSGVNIISVIWFRVKSFGLTSSESPHFKWIFESASLAFIKIKNFLN